MGNLGKRNFLNIRWLKDRQSWLAKDDKILGFFASDGTVILYKRDISISN